VLARFRMTWDVLGGRIQRKIFSNFEKVYCDIDCLLCPVASQEEVSG